MTSSADSTGSKMEEAGGWDGMQAAGVQATSKTLKSRDMQGLDRLLCLGSSVAPDG